MKNKICYICKVKKDLSKFSKQKDGKYGVSSWCKECRHNYYLKNKENIHKEYLKNKKEILKRNKKYKEKNKKTIQKQRKIYRQKNKIKLLNKYKEFYNKFPWKRALYHIQQRCNNINREDYKWYGLKGIKCLITEEELKELWFRNKAYLMKQPTIDRKDNNKNYTFENCQFLEKNIHDKKSGKEKSLLFINKTGGKNV